MGEGSGRLFEGEAVLGGDLGGGFEREQMHDVGENAEFHEVSDDVKRFMAEEDCQVGNGDLGSDGDFAREGRWRRLLPIDGLGLGIGKWFG